MSKILNFEDYLKMDRFQEQVILPLSEKNPIYESLRDGDNAVTYLHYHLYIYAFLKYIPYGVETELPTVNESFQNIVRKPRISTGEWVIEEFYRLKKEDALSIYPLIYVKNKSPNWFTELKNTIKNKSEQSIIKIEKQQLEEKQRRS